MYADSICLQIRHEQQHLKSLHEYFDVSFFFFFDSRWARLKCIGSTYFDLLAVCNLDAPHMQSSKMVSELSPIMRVFLFEDSEDN